MAKDVPLMEFQGDACAPILRYDIPSHSSYAGRQEIAIDILKGLFDGKPREGEEGYKGYARPTPEDILNMNRHAIERYLASVSRDELVELASSLGIIDAGRSIEGEIKIHREKFALEGLKTFDSMRRWGLQRGFTKLFDFAGQGLLTRPQRAAVARIDKAKAQPKPEAKAELFREILVSAFGRNKAPIFYTTMGGRQKVDFVDMPLEAAPTLMLVEIYKLSTFPGDYGAGDTKKTISLLPGEEREITVKTWKRSQTSIAQASSLFDSYTEDKADEFERGVQTEDSTTSRSETKFSYHAEAKAEASWGWGSAEVSGGVAGSSNSARESFSKNVMNAAEKHSQSSSAKREINVETSYERTEEQGEEQTITRRIKNLNASRVLNFVFRQMNQEFYSLLHIRDVRIGFHNGYPGSYREYALYEIPVLVSELMKQSIPEPTGFTPPVGSSVVVSNRVFSRPYLEALVLSQYGKDTVVDYEGNPRTLVEDFTVPGTQGPQHKYLRVIPPSRRDNQGNPLGLQEYVVRPEKRPKGDPTGKPIQEEYKVPVDGVITGAKRITMRTDGLIVESLLGKAAALDEYSLETQKAVLKRKQEEARKIEEAVKILQLMREAGKLVEAADAYAKMFGTLPKSE
jgi:hypothetical protein